MMLIKADPGRRITISGVPDPVQRPVDIDRSQTGFANLRSFRIYRFDKDSVIDGHAEEDEVFVVILAGSVEFTVSGDGSGISRTFHLASAENPHNAPCLAYLPPLSAYRLVARTDTEVAYARATPASGPPSQVFTARPPAGAPGITVLLEQKIYAQRLRIRLISLSTALIAIDFTPDGESESQCESLIHLRTTPPENAAIMTTPHDGPLQLESWDTAVLAPGDRPSLHIASRSSALILIAFTA